MTALSTIDPTERLPEQLQIALRRNQAGTGQRQVIVITGDTLEGPQQFRVYFPRQIKGRECRRLDPLYIPGVEIFVAAQAQVIAIAIAYLAGLVGALGQVVAGTHEAGGITMFQTAVPVAGDQRHEHIAIHGRRFAEHADMVFADRLQVPAQPRHIGLVTTGHHHPVRHTTGFELGILEGAHFHRMVDQGIVVVCPETAKTQLRAGQPGQPGSQVPAQVGGTFRCVDIHFAGLILVPHGCQEYTGAIEITVGGIQVGATHGQVPGVNVVLQLHRTIARWHLPGLLVDFRHGQRLTLATGLQIDQMAGEIPDHVAAGNPGRQRKRLPFRGRLRHGQRHFKKMGFRAQWANPVFDHGFSWKSGSVQQRPAW